MNDEQGILNVEVKKPCLCVQFFFSHRGTEARFDSLHIQI